tara:strand:+ start:4982 stop:5893 length:912 start_codon:yes stop_codon:yes gene_type:complete
MDSQNRLSDFLYLNWLRPENVVLETVPSIYIGEELAKSKNIMEVGIGNGYFTFLTLGGKFKKEYDWYYNVDLDGSPNKGDIFDNASVFNIADYLEVKPENGIRLAVDQNEKLITQARQLGFVEHFNCLDANERFSFSGIDTIFTNILHWLKNPFQALKYLEEGLPPGGKLISFFPGENFFEYCRSYKEENDTWKLINRKRRSTLKWNSSIEDFEKQASSTTQFKLIEHKRFGAKLTSQVWDIGLRLLAPQLCEMANNLSAEKRIAIKDAWCATCKPILEHLMENELEKGPTEGCYHFVVLQKT